MAICEIETYGCRYANLDHFICSVLHVNKFRRKWQNANLYMGNDGCVPGSFFRFRNRQIQYAVIILGKYWNPCLCFYTYRDPIQRFQDDLTFQTSVHLWFCTTFNLQGRATQVIYFQMKKSFKLIVEIWIGFAERIVLSNNSYCFQNNYGWATVTDSLDKFHPKCL